MNIWLTSIHSDFIEWKGSIVASIDSSSETFITASTSDNSNNSLSIPIGGVVLCHLDLWGNTRQIRVDDDSLLYMSTALTLQNWFVHYRQSFPTETNQYRALAGIRTRNFSITMRSYKVPESKFVTSHFTCRKILASQPLSLGLCNVFIGFLLWCHNHSKRRYFTKCEIQSFSGNAIFMVEQGGTAKAGVSYTKESEK